MKLRRPRPLDAVLVGALVLIVAAVVFLQLHLGGDPTSSPTSRASGPQISVTDGSSSPAPASSTASTASVSPSASAVPSAPSASDSSAQALQSSLAAQAQSLAAQQPATFQVATLNALGNSHTGPHGDEAARPAGPVRMRSSIAVLNAHHVDVVGLQELETIQARTFKQATGGAWQIYPDLPGDTRDAIAWRTAKFDLVQEQVVRVPYFNGAMVEMPVVLLRDKVTGKQVYFFNVHNSADTYKYHHQQGNRTSAMDREVQLIQQMHGYKVPVIFTGDMNERDDAFCLFTSRAPLHAAYGGTNGPGGCAPPKLGDWGVPIDWIFGTPDVTFTAPVMDHSGLVRAATDHPFYTATVTLQ